MREAQAQAYVLPMVIILMGHPGPQNAISERELSFALGISERDVRDVRALAETEYPILSTSGAGLYWGTCRDDFDHPIAQDKSMEIAYYQRIRRKKSVRDKWYPAEPIQMTLTEVANDS